MSDGAISQEEIDALLSGVDMGGLSGGGFSSSPSAKELDTSSILTFATDVSGTLSSSLETMTGTAFQVGTPVVENMNRDQLLRKIPEMVVAVLSDYTEALNGDHVFIMAPEFAQKLAGLINNEENPELDDMTLSVVSEVVSQHTGSEITALSKAGSLPGLACNPAEASYVPKAMVRLPSGDFVVTTYPISGEAGAFSLWEIVSSDVATGMIAALGGDTGMNNSTGALSPSELQGLGAMSDMGMQQPMGSMNMGGMNMGMQQPMGGMNMGVQQPMGAMNMGMQSMGMGMPQQMPMNGMNMGMNVPNVQSLQFPTLQGGPTSMEQGNIGLIMDVFMEMTVELGRTKKQIKEILGFGEGTIIELDKLAGEPVDILVNHKPIAKGEVVVIDENFGVRITEILSPIERVSDLH